MSEPRKVHVKSFGCQMNVYDSNRMADVLAPAGYVETAQMADADLVILNTCNIREKAVDKQQPRKAATCSSPLRVVSRRPRARKSRDAPVRSILSLARRIIIACLA